MNLRATIKSDAVFVGKAIAIASLTGCLIVCVLAPIMLALRAIGATCH